jgi:hypothetical protein
MKLRGITPPTILSTNSKPLPRGSASTSSQQSPNWPRPPDCFLYLPCELAVDAEFPLEPLDDELDVLLPGSREDDLPGLGIAVHAQ